MADIEQVRRKSKQRRVNEFAVRRWLVLGAASAGVGAALFAASLAGPQIGSAHADDSAQTSSAAGSADDSSSADQTRPDKPSDTAEHDAVAERDAAADEDESADGDEPASRSAAPESLGDADADAESERPDAHTLRESVSDREADNFSTAEDAGTADEDGEPVSGALEQQDSADDTSTSDVAEAQPKVGAPLKGYRESVADAIALWTRDSQGWIDSLQISDPFKDALTGTLWTVRRTFLNQAPTVAPVQIRGQIDGPIQGNIGAIDPDGDTLFYVLTRGPSSGTVAFNADGSYTYVPGTDFNGVDSFSVTALDPGLHTNVLDLFRPFATTAGLLVNQKAVTFDFDYTTGAQYWTPEAREALQRSANVLLMYILVAQPVAVRYEVAGRYEPGSGNLGSAGSGLISNAPGFHPTVVQFELLTGINVDEVTYDGFISFNMANNWAYGDTVASDQDDFYDTAIHELLHSFGFTSRVKAAGDNTRTGWSIFDAYLVTADGSHPIGADYVWDTEYDTDLTSKMYFAGPYAVAAYGGYVPLYTPSPWESGSSIAHTDDATFSGAAMLMMNAKGPIGSTLRRLSAIELGIMADLGYHINPLSSADLEPVLRLANQ